MEYLTDPVCHMACVTCPMSHVTCQVSHVMCQMFFLFYLQSDGASQWRVCYQQGRLLLLVKYIIW